VNNILIEKYLKLKYENMYITQDKISNMVLLSDINQLEHISPDIFYTVKPFMLYTAFSYDAIHTINEIFSFSEDVYKNISLIFPHDFKKYISVHLRLGDKFLETDKQFVLVKEDKRSYSEQKLFEFFEENHDKTILFFCDNHNYKMKVKEKYNMIILLSSTIGHTSLDNTTDKQVLDAVTEFYILSNSQIIYKASESGYSHVASKLNNIPLLPL